MEAKKDLKPDLGLGYKASYTDKKTGEAKNYLRLYIRADQLAEVKANDKGMVVITAFPFTGKKSEKSPDIILKPATTSSPKARAQNVSKPSNNSIF